MWILGFWPRPQPISIEGYESSRIFPGGFQGPELDGQELPDHIQSLQISTDAIPKASRRRFDGAGAMGLGALGPWGMVLGEGRPAAICQGLESLGFRLQRLSLLEEVSPRGPRGATRNWDWGGVSSRTWLGSLMSHAISCDFIISHPYFGSLDGSVIFGMGASSIRGWVRDPSSAAGTSRRLHG